MKKRLTYDLEVFKHDILINTETYNGNGIIPDKEGLIWISKEQKIMPINEYRRKKKIEERKSKIKKIKDKL